MKYLIQLLLLLCMSQALYAQKIASTEYYRHLRYNHVSPYISLAGIHPISQETAMQTSHYVFNYDEEGRLVEIINNHYHTEKTHPLASIGVYRMLISYDQGKETRLFYDKIGARMANDRKVYKEVFTSNKKGYQQLDFYDVDNQPMESNWGISTYQWEEKKGLIIERRFNLNNEPVNLSPYFPFGITGIELDKKGLPKEHFNLNEQLKPVENEYGIASYRDTYNQKSEHIQYAYYNAKGQLKNQKSGYAIGEKVYDDMGNHILQKFIDENQQPVLDLDVPTNAKTTLAQVASAKDSAEVKRVSLGYLIALQQMQPALMDEVMNDSLNKETIGYSRATKAEYAKRTTKEEMLAFAKTWNLSNTKFPPSPNNEAIILDIYNRIATVKLVSDNWVEYLQLIKLDGQWTIINLLWQHKDIGKYPKEGK